MWRKLGTSFLILLILFNFSFSGRAAAEAAPKLPPEIINPVPGQNGKYYVKNPNAPKPDLKLVEPRPNPGSSLRPKTGTIAGMMLQIYISSPQGQTTVQKLGSQIDGLANKLGGYIQGISDGIESSSLAAYNLAKSSGSTLWELGATSYTSIMNLIDKSFTESDITGLTTKNADGSYTYSNGITSLVVPIGALYSGETVVRSLGTFIGYGGNTRYLYVIIKQSNGYYRALRLQYSLSGVYSNQAHLGSATSSIDTALTTGYNDMNVNLDGVADPQLVTNNYKPTTDTTSKLYLNPSAGSVIVPSIPDETTIPGISKDSTTDIKYWEISSPYEDGQENISFVPVANPAAVPVPEVIIINKDGYQQLPDGSLSTEPVTEPVPNQLPDPTPEPTPDPLTDTGPYDPNNPVVPTDWDPISLLWPFLKFLLAMVAFLVKMADFIIRIPFTPQKKLPDPYGDVFEWFKNIQYGDINPYDLMITVATFLIGFLIYKGIRRFFAGGG